MSSVSGSPTSVGPRPTAWRAEDLPPRLRTALDAALDKKAAGPVVLRVTELAGYTDWVMIVSGRSERQVAAIADAISRALKAEGRAARGTDGFDGHQWDLLDYDDFIVHVFQHPVRTHFDLESMWSDAPRVELGLPAEVMDTSDLESTFEAPASAPEFRGDLRFGGFEDEFEDDDEDDAAWLDEDDDGPFDDADDEFDQDEQSEPDPLPDEDELPPGADKADDLGDDLDELDRA